MPTQGDFKETDLGATETTETNLGTITVPATGVSRIVGIYGIACIETPTAGEGSSANFRLSFNTVAGLFKFPAQVFQGNAGTLAGVGGHQNPKIIPVNIPIPSKEEITLYMTMHSAQTGTVRGMVGVIYE